MEIRTPVLEQAERCRAYAISALVLATSESIDRADARRAAALAHDLSRRASDAASGLIALRALAECDRAEGRFDDALERFRQLRVMNEPAACFDELDLLVLLDRADQVRHRIDAPALAGAARTSGLSGGLAAIRLRYEFAFGNLASAERAAHDVLASVEDDAATPATSEAHLTLAHAAYLRGDRGAARRALMEAERRSDPASDVALRIGTVRAGIALDDGDVAGAASIVRRSVRRLDGSTHVHRWDPLSIVRALRVAVAASDAEMGRRLVTAFTPGLEGDRREHPRAVIGWYARGLLSGSVPDLARAGASLASSPRTLLKAEISYDLGLALVRDGRSRAAAVAIADASDGFASYGATARERAAERLLRDAGIKGRRGRRRAVRPVAGWAALTDAERRVARLIGEGHSNRSASAHLHASSNTVATHVRAIFGKLDIHSRSELTRIVLTES